MTSPPEKGILWCPTIPPCSCGPPVPYPFPSQRSHPAPPSPPGPLDLSSQSSSSSSGEEDDCRTSDLPAQIPVTASSAPTAARPAAAQARSPRHQLTHCTASPQTAGAASPSPRAAFHGKHCPKEYTSLGALKMHIRSPHAPCVCTTCGKAFSRPWLTARTHPYSYR